MTTRKRHGTGKFGWVGPNGLVTASRVKGSYGSPRHLLTNGWSVTAMPNGWKEINAPDDHFWLLRGVTMSQAKWSATKWFLSRIAQGLLAGGANELLAACDATVPKEWTPWHVLGDYLHDFAGSTELLELLPPASF